ncbi:MAG TPA: RHS repeat-associated core domain-containing protein [Gemmataceae bacterium]|jgi:RHS repeat-associated protein
MPTTTGETWKFDDSDAGTERERIQLIPAPKPKTDDGFASTNTTPQLQLTLFQQFQGKQNTDELDTLFGPPPDRPSPAPKHPQRPQGNNDAPNPQALAGTGGGRAGGSSTSNPSGGGSGGGSSGSGPGVIIANQFLTAYLNMVGSALTPNAAPSAASPVPAANLSSTATPATAPMQTATPADTSAPQISPNSMKFAVLDPRTGNIMPALPSGSLDGVFDMNNGQFLPRSSTVDTFSTYGLNLLAQVPNIPNATYSWNLTQAPDLTGASGQNTMNLQGSWASFTGTTRTETLSVTERPPGGMPDTWTVTFLVGGTDSPAYAPTPPTSSATWPTVLTPDQIAGDQASVDAGPDAGAGLADGSVQTAFAMPSYNPNADPVGLIYNSATADPHPIFQVLYQEPALPSVFQAQLTLNGTAFAPVYYSDAGISGLWNQIALQGDATGLSTGRYPWQITLSDPNTGHIYVTDSGSVDIVNRINGPYGDGWTVDGVEQLLPVTGGVMLVNPDGTSLFFAGSGGSYTSPAGDFSTLTQTGGVWTRTLTDGTQINFNSSGQQTSIVDTDGNTTTYSYTGGLLTGITDLDGQTTTLAYSGGMLSSITDPAGHTATLGYGGSYFSITYSPNQLTSITDPAANLWQYRYTSSTVSLLTALVDANNHTTNFSYGNSSQYAGSVASTFVTSVGAADGTFVGLMPRQTLGLPEFNLGSFGAPANPAGLGEDARYTDQNNKTWTTGMDWLGFGEDVQDDDPLGDVAFTNLDPNGLPWMTWDAVGERERSFFDSKGNVTKDVAPDDSFWQYSYNNFSEVTQATDPTGSTTTYSYNPKGDLTGITDALLNTTTLTYNPQGFVTSIEDPLLHTTTFGYNPLNLLTTITNALNQSTTFAYDNAGNLTTLTDARGFASTFAYNPLGWMTGETLPIDSTTNAVYTYSYDKVGNLTGETTPSGDTISYGYSPVNRMTSFNDPAVGLTTYAYSAVGLLTLTTDPLGHTMGYGYDNAGRSTSATDGLGNTTTYTYYATGQVKTVEDPLTHTTTYTYTKTGQVASVTTPLGTTSYQYDLAGLLTALTDPDNNTTSYTYDQVHELTRMTDPLGHSTTYAYQGGLLTSTTDRDGRTINYGYDPLNRLSSETWVGGNYTATYNYDPGGNLTMASDPFSSYSYGYNEANQLTSVDNAGTPGVPHVVLTYGYDSSGNRKSLTDGLGGSITYGFDNANRLTSLALSLNNTLAAQVTLAYDGANRLTGLTRTSPGGDTITSSFSYDSADRLTNITHTDTSKTLTLASYTYGYDAANRLTSYQDNSGSSLTYGYDPGGELTSASGMLNGSSYSVSYSYDANGNRNMSGYTTGTGNELTSDGVNNYTYDNEGNTLTQTNIATGSVTYFTWDYRNRLTEVQVKDSHGTLLNDEKFTYDVNNNRIGVSLNGVQQLYTVYDGSNPYMDFNGSGTLTERYLTAPDALSQFFGQENASGTPQWFLTDNINSIRQVVSTSGTSMDAITYDPFGKTVSQTNAPNAPRFGYAGGEQDAFLGIYRFGGRWYNPATGEWLSQDPLGFGGEDTNLDRYVGNDPTDAVDPTGEVFFRTSGLTWIGTPNPNSKFELELHIGTTGKKLLYDIDQLITETNRKVNETKGKIKDFMKRISTLEAEVKKGHHVSINRDLIAVYRVQVVLAVGELQRLQDKLSTLPEDRKLVVKTIQEYSEQLRKLTGSAPDPFWNRPGAYPTSTTLDIKDPLLDFATKFAEAKQFEANKELAEHSKMIDDLSRIDPLAAQMLITAIRSAKPK